MPFGAYALAIKDRDKNRHLTFNFLPVVSQLVNLCKTKVINKVVFSGKKWEFTFIFDLINC